MSLFFWEMKDMIQLEMIVIGAQIFKIYVLPVNLAIAVCTQSGW